MNIPGDNRAQAEFKDRATKYLFTDKTGREVKYFRNAQLWTYFHAHGLKCYIGHLT